MPNILINYSIVKNDTKEHIESIIQGCSSKKNKIILNIYDFSLNKKVKDIIQRIQKDDNIKITVLDKDFEDADSFLKLVLSTIIQYGDCIAFTALNDNSILKKYAIDNIDLEKFEESIYGFTYFDYNVNNIRCYLKSIVGNISVPVIFFSTQKVINSLAEDDTIKHVLSHSISSHIPKSLCNIYT